MNNLDLPLDWNLVWAAIGGVSGTLSFFLMIFLEWPRVKSRLSKPQLSLRNIALGSGIILGFIGAILFGVSLFVVGTQSSDGTALGRLGLFLTFYCLTLILSDMILGDIKQGERGPSFWVSLIALPGLIIGMWSFLQGLISG